MLEEIIGEILILNNLFKCVFFMLDVVFVLLGDLNDVYCGLVR